MGWHRAGGRQTASTAAVPASGTYTRVSPPAFPAASESAAADTREPRAPSAPRPPRLRRSPEAGGELSRGLQAGVPGGGDFVLGANLSARREVGVLKKNPKGQEKEKEGGRWGGHAQKQLRCRNTHLSPSCGSSR